MSLREVQQAIAELVCDAKSLEAFAKDSRAWSIQQRLREREARLVEGLDPADVRVFHEIHARDRAYFLEAILPLTIARIGEAWSHAYFAKHPFGDDDVRIESARYVEHLERGGGETGAIHLARFEIAQFRLLDEPVFDAPPSLEMRLPTQLRTAPGIAIVPSAIHLPRLVEDPRGAPERRRGVALLRRDPDGVTSAWLEGLEARVLAAIANRDERELQALARNHSARRALIRVIADGVVA